MFSGLPGDAKLSTASFDGSVTLGGSVNLTQGNLGNRIQVEYLVSTNHIQLLRNGSVIADFAPTELSADSSGTLALYERGNVPLVNIPQEVFELHVPMIDGVALSYTRFGTYAKVNANLLTISASNINPLAAFVFGQATPAGSMPHSGSAMYTSDIFGAVVVPGNSPQFYSLGGGHGSATFGVDFTAGTIDTLINLAADGHDFGSLQGTGALLSGGPAFNGTLSGSGTGQFTGSFFGPTAQEMGYVFEGQQGTSWLAYGNVFGKAAPPPP